MEVLAEVTWDNLVMVGTAMGLLGGVQVLRERRQNGRANPDTFNHKLCDEKHKNIDTAIVNIESHQKSIAAKLDRLIEHFL